MNEAVSIVIDSQKRNAIGTPSGDATLNTAGRIDQALDNALRRVSEVTLAPRLAQAVRYAVFPGGGRLRPRLCCAVAAACGAKDGQLIDGAAAAIELIHCASLVHDDLPCFDDAALRRGRPSVHRAFGEPLAVLAGDALIVLAFEVIAVSAVRHPRRMPALIRNLAYATGLPSGIAAGQALEQDDSVSLSMYQAAKTGALFAAATVAGALAAGHEPEAWRCLGERLGEAYQVADDIRDVAASVAEIGKPTGRDAALARPSAVAEHGLRGALERLKGLVHEAVAAIPPCEGHGELRSHIMAEASGMLPEHLRTAA